MAIKIILIDDEAGVRLLLRKIIEKHSAESHAAFEIVGESDNLAEAVTLFTRVMPDVVFLDIEMKGASGIECARIIADLNPKAKIIFATAHDQYMPEAFEVYAFDYLVKPFSVDRVKRTLSRIQNGMLPQEAFDIQKELPDRVQKEKETSRLLIKGKESASFVEIEDIILIQREERNTVIYTAEESYITSAALGELENRLSDSQFLRSHKSYIINVSKIKRIEPYGRWTYIVLFKGFHKDALITAEKYEELKKRYD